MADVLAIVTSDPGRPRLTWYGDGGERIELSGAVVANWVAKTTNLLVEEFDVAPGVRVGLDLPVHWRTAVWALAVWRAGGEVTLGPDAGTADVVVTDRPGTHAAATALVAVALPALARRFEGDLPAGAVDAAGAVMTYGDAVGWAPPVDPAAAALTTADAAVPHAALAAWARAGAAEPGARTLLTAAEDREPGVTTLLRTTLGVLGGDGSLVVLARSVADDLGKDPSRMERLTRAERITG